MRKKVKFGSKIIGDNERVPFIAEIGVNHLGKISNALELVESAVRAGSDFLKFQTYIAEDRYDKNNPRYKLIHNKDSWSPESISKKLFTSILFKNMIPKTIKHP